MIGDASFPKLARQVRPGLNPSEPGGYLLAVASAAGLGAATVAVKLGIQAHVGLVMLVEARLVMAMFVLWALVLGLRLQPRPAGRRLVLLLMLGAVATSPWFFSTAALAYLSAGTVALLLFTFPVWVTLLELALRHERFRWGKFTSLALGLVGISLVIGGPPRHPSGPGVILALAAALVLAVYLVVVAELMDGIHPLACNAVVNTGGAVTVMPIVVLSHAVATGIPLGGWGPLLMLGLTSGVGVASYLPALARIGPMRLSLTGNLQPLVTVGLAALILGERLSPVQLIGGALIIGSVALLPITGKGRGARDADLRRPGTP